MAGLQFLNISEDDFSGGIDVRSAENQVAKSYSEDLLNVETIERRLRKRKGTQGKAGNVPVRVISMTHSTAATDNVCFTLDTSIDLGTLRSSPVIVYGRNSTAGASGGPSTEFGTTSTVHYYPGFTTTVRKSFAAGTGTVVVPEAEHNLGTANIYFGVVESTSTVNLSNSVLLGTTSYVVDETSFDVTIGYTNSSLSPVSVIPYYLSRNASAGTVYVTSTTASSISITAGTHGLTNFNIVAQIWADTTAGGAGTRTLVTPDSFTVSAAGQVDITFSQTPAAGLAYTPPDGYNNYTIILTAVDAANYLTTSIANGTSGSLVLSSPTGPFIFSSVYRTNGTSLEMVDPDSVSYDPVAGTTTWSLTNGSGATQTFAVYYEYGTTRSNELCVTGSLNAGTNYTDTAPQLTIWGLDHSEIYAGLTDARQGWVSQIDSYRSTGESRLICSLGGNLFTESDDTTTYSMGSSSPDLTHTVDGTQVLGPLLWDSSETPGRTRGYVTATLAGTHWGKATAVSYNSSTGLTEYTISLPGKAILDSTGTPTSLSAVISTTSGLEDWLTVEGMGYDRHNGTFRIRSVTDGVDQIVIAVQNADVDSADWDDTDTGGLTGIFTDQVNFTATTTLIPADQLLSSVLSSHVITVTSAAADIVVVSGVTDSISLGSGLSISALRTSAVIPLSSVTGFVRGDMVAYSSVSRLLRVLRINPGNSLPVSIVGDGTTATITVTGTTEDLSEGQQIILTDAGEYTGVVTVATLISTTVFTISSGGTTTTAGTLLGKTLQLDEAISWEDTPTNSTSFSVPERWVPVEAPTSSGDLLPATHVRYQDSGDYDNQDFIRSTMVSNNSYLTNDADEVLKYDGNNIYRGGFFPWQPSQFLTQDTAATAKISTSARSLASGTVNSASGTVKATTPGDEFTFPVGTLVRFTGSLETYTVRGIDSTNNLIQFDRAIVGGAAAPITQVIRYSYYFRLNAVDANNNIVGSAVTGSQDYVVELTGDAAVNIRLVGFPAWDNYDYDRIDLQVYRTRAGLSAPFYLVDSKPITLNHNDGYIDFTDTISDDGLVDLDQTSVLQDGLGTGWQEPLRAKYITSAGNSLILANVRDYPQLDIQIRGNTALADTDFAGDYLLFHRTTTAIGTTTTVTDTFRYDWVQTSSGAAITSVVGVAGTSFTVTTTAPHGMTTGDWAYLFWTSVATAGRPLTYSGWWQITKTAADTFTVTHTGATAGALPGVGAFALLTATDPTNVPVPLGTDGNWGTLNGNSTISAFSAARRMSLAINATARKVDTTISGMSTFVPWLTARGGGDFKAGQIVVRQPRSDAAGPSLVPVFSGYDLFVNDVRQATGVAVSSQIRTYPSRLLFSFENYPELFDRPTSILDSESDSAIDVNPADGQEITGVIPFFGDAAFGAAQQSAVVVVFKSNSVYLIDLNEKRNGRNPLQRIETEGLGCTAPYSIAVTKNGIIFANESGIYSLGRNLSISYVGKLMERNWLGSVNRDQLSIMQGHHYAVGRQYKLSVPVGTAGTTSEVYVYDHTAEMPSTSYTGARSGSWSRFDSHPATGWANLAQDAYYSTSTGRVFSVRRAGDLTDYRDDSSSITCRIMTRAMDFGNAGIRKCLDGFAAHYRVLATSDSTTVSTSLDMREDFHELDGFVLNRESTTDGMSDLSARKMRTIWHSVGRRKGVYFQVVVENMGLDEDLELAGIDFKVAGLSDKGILMAAETSTLAGS